MTSAEPIPDEDRKNRADWMAVHHANRAVTVAWFSALVNLLVVFVALGTPLIQSMIERSSKVREEYNNKVSLINEAKKTFNDGVESRSSVRNILNPDFSIDNNAYDKQLYENIEELDFVLSNHEREVNFLFGGVSSDIGYRSLASIMATRFNHIRVAAKRTRFFLNNREVATPDVAKDAENAFMRSYDNDLRELRLAILLNSDPKGGVASTAETAYGTCTDEVSKRLCAQPLKILP